MKTIKIFHLLSFLKWLFLLWLLGLLIDIFIFKPDDSLQKIGTVLSVSGIMMGFSSLSDITKVSKKEKRALSNPKYVKWRVHFFVLGIVILFLISMLFFSVGVLFPKGDPLLVDDFRNLGYDCLVMILGFLCLIKQFTEQVEYVKNIERE